MSTHTDDYIEEYDLEDYNLVTGKILIRDLIFTQGNPALDSPENVHLGIKEMVEENY